MNDINNINWRNGRYHEIIKSLDESGLTNKNGAKEQQGRYLNMLLGILGASFSGNLLTCKGVKAKIPGQGVIRGGDRTFRANQDF